MVDWLGAKVESPPYTANILCEPIESTPAGIFTVADPLLSVPCRRRRYRCWRLEGRRFPGRDAPADVDVEADRRFRVAGLGPLSEIVVFVLRGAMIKLALAAVSVPSLAVRSKSPAVLITRPLNVATPLTAPAVAVLIPVEKVAPLSVRVTVEESLATAFPQGYCTATCTPGAGVEDAGRTCSNGRRREGKGQRRGGHSKTVPAPPAPPL